MKTCFSLRPGGEWTGCCSLTDEQYAELATGPSPERAAEIYALTKKSASPAEEAAAQAIFEKHMPEGADLISCDITLPDGYGIINCRVEGEHLQVRF